MKLESIKRHIRAHGVLATCHSAAYKLANRLFPYMTMKCVWITSDDLKRQSSLENSFGYSARFLEPRELAGFLSRSEYGISEVFLRSALEKGDECYGILDGDDLACFGWYSQKPTAINDDLTLHFDPAYVYMYFGFTHPNYRGKRLHALDMALALQEFTGRGCKGMVSYVESINYASLKSCYRMGYKNFGVIRTLKLFGRYWILHSSGCRQFQFCLVPRA